jgi:hypothetical protein
MCCSGICIRLSKTTIYLSQNSRRTEWDSNLSNRSQNPYRLSQCTRSLSSDLPFNRSFIIPCLPFSESCYLLLSICHSPLTFLSVPFPNELFLLCFNINQLLSPQSQIAICVSLVPSGSVRSCSQCVVLMHMAFIFSLLRTSWLRPKQILAVDHRTNANGN